MTAATLVLLLVGLWFITQLRIWRIHPARRHSPVVPSDLRCVLVNAQEGGSQRAQGTGSSETSRTCWSATFRRIAVAA
jgi:hypothetical protein